MMVVVVVVVVVLETRRPAPPASSSDAAGDDEAGRRIFDTGDFDVERAQREVRLARRRGHQEATHYIMHGCMSRSVRSFVRGGERERGMNIYCMRRGGVCVVCACVWRMNLSRDTDREDDGERK